MPLRTIQIARRTIDFDGKRTIVSDEIDGCDVLGDFAIHERITPWPASLLWTVTHIPTGWACLHTRTKRAALAARREFVGCGLAFDFSDPAAMSAECRAVGKEIKSRWEGR